MPSGGVGGGAPRFPIGSEPPRLSLHSTGGLQEGGLTPVFPKLNRGATGGG